MAGTTADDRGVAPMLRAVHATARPCLAPAAAGVALLAVAVVVCERAPDHPRASFAILVGLAQCLLTLLNLRVSPPTGEADPVDPLLALDLSIRGALLGFASLGSAWVATDPESFCVGVVAAFTATSGRYVSRLASLALRAPSLRYAS